MDKASLYIVLSSLCLRAATPPLPDFAIEAIDFQPAIIADGRPLTVAVTVTNRGTASGDGRYLDIWYTRPGDAAPQPGEVGDWWGPIGQLQPGESRTIIAPPQVVHGDIHRLCAFVAFEKLKTELIATNNHACQEYQLLRGNCELDFDGDGRVDQALFHASVGDWYVKPTTAPAVQQPFGWSATIAVPADYDGDGKADLAVYHPSGGTWYLLESGSGLTREIALGDASSAPVPGDYDGDGKADPAVFHQATATWRIQGSRYGLISINYGWSSVIPVPEDYDGDGKTDLAIYHPPTGAWHIRDSSTEHTRSSAFGWNAAVPVPADYDGDGRADIAVFHRAEAKWYISFSGGGSLTQQFGWSTVLPIAADYDGDGKSDIAVYAPPSGGWHIRLSSTGATVEDTYGFSSALPVLLMPTLHKWYQLP